MKILETRYNKIPAWLVFDGTEIVGKFDSKKEAEDYVEQNRV